MHTHTTHTHTHAMFGVCIIFSHLSLFPFSYHPTILPPFYPLPPLSSLLLLPPLSSLSSPFPPSPPSPFLPPLSLPSPSPPSLSSLPSPSSSLPFSPHAGVGGIEAEAIMLGQTISMVLPEVVGYKLIGAVGPLVTSTDVVLTITKVRGPNRNWVGTD